MTTIGRALPGFPLQFLQAALVAGLDVGVGADDLERTLLAAADQRRNLVLHSLSTAYRAEQTSTIEVVVDGRSLSPVGPDQAAIGTVEIGPAAMGVIARFRPATGAIRIGERAAQYASALLDFADREYGTDFGPCLPAPDPR